MDDVNEMARLHSAGATVKHCSPFDILPTYKNDNHLHADFIKRWVAPYYMEIGSSGNATWIVQIKKEKEEITKQVCLNLLGNFNWRTRLVGSYFAAVKDYRELIDIIGTHLLKSEVCCVGHIYALTLAYFNDEKCIQYLNDYLDYYLAKPSLYFDQKFVMEAVLYLDKQNDTHYFADHKEKWDVLQVEQCTIEEQQAIEVQKIAIEGETETLQNCSEELEGKETKKEEFSIEYFHEQIAILRELNQYGC